MQKFPKLSSPGPYDDFQGYQKEEATSGKNIYKHGGAPAVPKGFANAPLTLKVSEGDSDVDKLSGGVPQRKSLVCHVEPLPSPSWQAGKSKRRPSQMSEYPAPWPIFESQLDTPSMSQEKFESEIRNIVEDLFISADYDECALSVAALDCESLHDLMMQKVIQAAIDKGPAHFPTITNLASTMLKSQQLTEVQLLRALHSFSTSLHELMIDVPRVSEYLYIIVANLVEAKCLDQNVICQFPESVLREGKVEPHLTNLRTFKKLTKPLIETYFHTSDFAVLDEGLRRINNFEFHHEFLKQAALISFDRNRRERAILLQLVDNAHENDLVDASGIQLSFACLLGYLEDGKLDCPHMSAFVTDIFTRAITNELVSADLLHRYLRLNFGGSSGRSVLEKVLHQTPEHSRKVWGDGDLEHLEKEMQNTIAEFFDSADMQEVGQILGELHLSKEYDVKFLHMLFLEAMNRQQLSQAIELAHYLLDIYWTKTDIGTVIEQIRSESHDLVLDIPNVREYTTYLIDGCHAVGALENCFMEHAFMEVV